MGEFDKDHVAFQAEWDARASIVGKVFADAFVRIEACRSARGPATFADPALTPLLIRVDGVGFDAYFDPKAVGSLVAEWRRVLDTLASVDARVFTKDFIVQALAEQRHRHGGPGAAMVICGALWLVAEADDTLPEMIADSRSALHFDITNDATANLRRLAVEIADR